MHTCEKWVRLAKKGGRIADWGSRRARKVGSVTMWLPVAWLWVVAANGIMGGLLQVVIGGSIAQTFYLVKSRVQDAGMMQSRTTAAGGRSCSASRRRARRSPRCRQPDAPCTRRRRLCGSSTQTVHTECTEHTEHSMRYSVGDKGGQSVGALSLRRAVQHVQHSAAGAESRPP